MCRGRAEDNLLLKDKFLVYGLYPEPDFEQAATAKTKFKNRNDTLSLLLSSHNSFPLPPNPSARLLSAIHLQFAFLNGLVIFG